MARRSRGITDKGQKIYDELIDIAFSAPDYANGEQLYTLIEGRIAQIIDLIESNGMSVDVSTGEVIDVYNLTNAQIREIAEDVFSFEAQQHRGEVITSAYGVAYESQEGERLVSIGDFIKLIYGRPADPLEILELLGDEPWAYL